MLRKRSTEIKRRLRALILCLTCFAAAISVTSPAYAAGDNQSSFQIDFIDVGQGDAALVQCDGHYMLVDGGDSKQSSRIYSILKNRGINKIDVMVATHPDADHIGGLSGALNYASVDRAYSPVTDHDTKTFKSFVKYLTKQGVPITIPDAGDSFTLGSAKATILGPRVISSDSNNNSIILRIEYGDTSFLLTGDAETEEENSILNSGQKLQSTVLKVAHHGSAHSTGYRFLREVAPEYAVISVGSDNTYGHPTETVLSRLRDADVKTFRTDMQGDITCVSDGKTVSFSTRKNSDADTLADAGLGQKSGVSTLIPYGTDTVTTDRAISDDNGMNETQAGTSVEASYVLNKNTHKFHVPGCKSVSQMKEKNKGYFTGSREELISQGYSPCKNCNP